MLLILIGWGVGDCLNLFCVVFFLLFLFFWLIDDDLEFRFEFEIFDVFWIFVDGMFMFELCDDKVKRLLYLIFIVIGKWCFDVVFVLNKVFDFVEFWILKFEFEYDDVVLGVLGLVVWENCFLMFVLFWDDDVLFDDCCLLIFLCNGEWVLCLCDFIVDIDLFKEWRFRDGVCGRLFILFVDWLEWRFVLFLFLYGVEFVDFGYWLLCLLLL